MPQMGGAGRAVQFTTDDRSYLPVTSAWIALFRLDVSAKTSTQQQERIQGTTGHDGGKACLFTGGLIPFLFPRMWSNLLERAVDDHW